MDALNNITLPSGGKVDFNSYMDALEYLLKSKSSVLNGFVSTIADLIHDKRSRGEKYLGDSSSNHNKCISDARNLVARMASNVSPLTSFCGLLEEKIKSKAYEIYEAGGDEDAFKNWMSAQEGYARECLDYYIRLSGKEIDQINQMAELGRTLSLRLASRGKPHYAQLDNLEISKGD